MIPKGYFIIFFLKKLLNRSLIDKVEIFHKMIETSKIKSIVTLIINDKLQNMKSLVDKFHSEIKQ